MDTLVTTLMEAQGCCLLPLGERLDRSCPRGGRVLARGRVGRTRFGLLGLFAIVLGGVFSGMVVLATLARTFLTPTDVIQVSMLSICLIH